jgi:hypothetical protein
MTTAFEAGASESLVTGRFIRPHSNVDFGQARRLSYVSRISQYELGGCHDETDTKTKGKSIKDTGEYLLVGRAHRRSRTGEEVPAGLLRHF